MTTAPPRSDLRNITLRIASPWMLAEMDGVHDLLSWSLNRPGFQRAHRVVWREVRNADLPRDLDPKEWLIGELRENRLDDAVALITSRGLDRHVSTYAEVETVGVDCVATVGLSNGERVGRRRTDGGPVGTINILARSSMPLSEPAMVEALSIVAEARTLAIVEAGHDCGTGIATGTGTDCIVIAAPHGPDPLAFAGLHTPLGEALGKAVLSACRAGVTDWLQEQAEIAATGRRTVAKLQQV